MRASTINNSLTAPSFYLLLRQFKTMKILIPFALAAIGVMSTSAESLRGLQKCVTIQSGSLRTALETSLKPALMTGATTIRLTCSTGGTVMPIVMPHGARPIKTIAS